MKDRIVVWGASGHARVVADILKASGGWDIVGFIESLHPERKGKKCCGDGVILGGKEQLEKLLGDGITNMAIGVGDCAARLRLISETEAAGFSLPCIIHPGSIVAGDATIGDGTVLAAGAVVGSGAMLGRGVIVNTCASVDHDDRLDEAVHVSPGAHLAGNVTVKRGSWIGIGACVKEGITIGEWTVVGAGAAVVKDLPDRVVAMGVPAVPVRQNDGGAQ